jgi:DNA-binding beta-propeller fold protein YncE
MGVAVDDSGCAYVTGYSGSRDFPVTAGAFSTAYRSSSFVTKLNATGTALVYSTYLAGDQANAIAVDHAGNAYVAGKTPYISPAPAGFQPTFGGGRFDAFVTKLNASGSALLYSTFLGGADDDGAYSIAVDATGAAYVAGMTLSSNFPTTSGAFQTHENGGSDGFVVKIDPTGSLEAKGIKSRMLL